MFNFEINAEAIDDLRQLQPHERKFILDSIEAQLTHQPDIPSKNRKPLRPNAFFSWELRSHPFRVFYEVDVNARRVLIQRVGRKEGNSLYIRGQKFNLTENEDNLT